jgi:hypothetical protein
MKGLAVGLVALSATAAQPAAADWSPSSRVPGTVGTGFPYDADIGGGGRVAVAVVKRGIRVIVRDPAGRWAAPELISPARASATAPDVEVTGRGEVLVAWTQSSSRRLPVSGPNAIHVAVRSTGGRWSFRVVGGTRHFIAAEPRLAVNARGDAAVIWRGWHRRGGRDRLLTAFRPAGGRFGRAASMGEAGIDQQVAVDSSGRVYTTWTRTLPPEHLRSQIRFAARVAGAWSRPETVAEDRVGGPQLALVPDGSLVAAWRASERGLGATRSGEVMAATRSADGGWGPAHGLSSVRTKAIHLGTSAAGEVVAAWSPAPPPLPERQEFALYLATRPPGGDFSPASVTPGLVDGPLAVTADGTALTLMEERGVRAAVRPPGGAFGPTVRLGRVGGYPALTSWGDTALAVWLTFAPDRLRLATYGPG